MFGIFTRLAVASGSLQPYYPPLKIQDDSSYNGRTVKKLSSIDINNLDELGRLTEKLDFQKFVKIASQKPGAHTSKTLKNTTKNELDLLCGKNISAPWFFCG